MTLIVYLSYLGAQPEITDGGGSGVQLKNKL